MRAAKAASQTVAKMEKKSAQEASGTATKAGGTSGKVAKEARNYAPAPKNIDGIPGLISAKPKTPVKGGRGMRKRWKDKKGNIYEWDSQHGTVEKYDKRGNHLGEFDPKTGAQVKPRDKTRKVEP